jgi:hypothetical protein
MEELNVLPSEMLLKEEQHTIVFASLWNKYNFPVKNWRLLPYYVKIRTFATYIFSVSMAQVNCLGCSKWHLSQGYDSFLDNFWIKYSYTVRRPLVKFHSTARMYMDQSLPGTESVFCFWPVLNPAPQCNFPMASENSIVEPFHGQEFSTGSLY